jgi:hypothetical protein
MRHAADENRVDCTTNKRFRTQQLLVSSLVGKTHLGSTSTICAHIHPFTGDKTALRPVHGCDAVSLDIDGGDFIIADYSAISIPGLEGEQGRETFRCRTCFQSCAITRTRNSIASG